MSATFLKSYFVSFLWFCLLSTLVFSEVQATTYQNRPPEMVQADRKQSPFPELVNFENLDGWKLETSEGILAKLTLSDESIVYGKYAAKIVVESAKKGTLTLIPPSPIIVPTNFNSVNLWARYLPYQYGGGIKTNFFINLLDNSGQTYRVALGHGDWGIWEILNTRLIAPDNTRFNYTPSQKMIEPVYLKNIELELEPGTAEPPFIFYLDSLCIYKEDLSPLKFKFSPAGLPKPTTKDTILPLCKKEIANEIHKSEKSYRFICSDDNEKVVYEVTPQNGTLSDINVKYNGKNFQPCYGGGIVFKLGDKVIRPDNKDVKVNKALVQLKNGILTTQWELHYDNYKACYRLEYQVKRKSLIIDITTENNNGVEVALGYVTPAPGAKLIQVPYLRFEEVSPQIVSYKNLFLSAFFDWWNSDATSLYAKNGSSEDSRGVYYNGGTKYNALTDGRYNNIRERLFITVSGDFQEVLPNIPNPKSPYLDQYKSAVWRWLYGGPRKTDWVKQLYDYGVENFMIRFHADAMRDAEESYALRTHTAASIGDSLFKETGEKLKNMGYGFAVYSCYLTVDGVNKEFDPDILNRNTLGDTTARFLRYRIKPLSFLEIHSRLAPEIHDRFGTNFSYLDVHACRAPWRDTDCDARVPMAGMFRLDFLANAQVMLNDRAAHNGPVWSEGGMQYLYAGFVDAAYGYMGPEIAWDKASDIVDLDLLYLHPRMINIGMGDLSMYFKKTDFTKPANRFNSFLDRFIAATIAYGHAAWLEYPARFGLDGALKAYYLTNAVQSKYIGVDVEKIGYFDGKNIIDTSRAIQTDAYKRKQIYVRYKNNLEVWTNLNHENKNWKIAIRGKEYTLPSGGFIAYCPDELLAYSAQLNDTSRHEYVMSPNYIYLDTRDQPLVLEGIGLCKGAAAIKVINNCKLIIYPLPSFEKLQINLDKIPGIVQKEPHKEYQLCFYNKETQVHKIIQKDKNGWLTIEMEPDVSKLVLDLCN
jgi:hypothetical protein